MIRIISAPESTKASDAYSFALIVYEILTKEKPFNLLKSTNQILIEVVTKSERPKFQMLILMMIEYLNVTKN